MQLHTITSTAMNHWHHVEPYAKIPGTKSEYKKQLAVLDELMLAAQQKKNKHVFNLIQLIARNLQLYEEEHFMLEQAPPTDILAFLMDEHGLSQKDLPEIGSQTLVSKILKGERQLTAKQIGRLANRFHISPAAFYDIAATNESTEHP